MTDRLASEQPLWCRVEEEAGQVARVNLMHPNGEILFSYTPEHFDGRLLSRMRAGQVRALVSRGSSPSTEVLSFVDEMDEVLHLESAPPRFPEG